MLQMTVNLLHFVAGNLLRSIIQYAPTLKTTKISTHGKIMFCHKKSGNYVNTIAGFWKLRVLIGQEAGPGVVFSHLPLPNSFELIDALICIFALTFNFPPNGMVTRYLPSFHPMLEIVCFYIYFYF